MGISLALAGLSRIQYIMKHEVDAWSRGSLWYPLMCDELSYAGLKERDTGRKLVPYQRVCYNLGRNAYM
jgi:hypothetical protein